jgi:hypothetical protein
LIPCYKAPTPYSTLESVLNHQKQFLLNVGCETTICHASYDIVHGPNQFLFQIPFEFQRQNIWILQNFAHKMVYILELSVKSSKESTKTVSLLKTGNKVVEVE